MTFVLTAALRSSALIAAGWIAARGLSRAPAELRRRLWVAVICAAGVLPLALAAADRAAGGVSAALRLVAIAPEQADSAIAGAIRRFSWLRALWAAGAALLLGRVALSLVRLALLTRAAGRRDDAWYSSDVATPATWGIVRPVILLPGYAAEWPAERRRMLVRHEEAHVEHHDWLWLMTARVVCAIFWFSPFVWLAAWELRRESERAADDCVLGDGFDADLYAAELLNVARRARSFAAPAAVAMAAGAALEDRVRRILDVRRRRGASPIVLRLAVVAAVFAIVVPLAARQNQVYRVGDVGLEPPRPVYKMTPRYTKEALRSRVEGSVILDAEVSEDGVPENIQVEQSLDEGLDRNAQEALAAWQFEPGRVDGCAVRVAVTVTMEFVLR